MSFKAFLNSLKDSAAKLAELEIKTVVGGTAQGDKTIVTKIDLIGSDIHNELDVSFVTGSLVSVRDFHNEQVKRAEAMMNSRLAFIADAFEKLADLAKDEDGGDEGQ